MSSTKFFIICLQIVLMMMFQNTPLTAQNLWTNEILSFRKQHVAGMLEKIEIAKDIVYGHTPEQTLLLDIYYPLNPPTGPLPAVVWIHGGGLKHLDKNYELIQWCAAYTALAGYISVSVEYRLLGAAPLPAAIEDCKTAVRFLRANAEKYNIDPDRMGVGGESAGGYLAAFAALTDSSDGFDGEEWGDYSSRVNCAAVWYGVTRWYKNNPLLYVTPDDPPILLIHGDNDKIVGLDHSIALQYACRHEGVPVELRIIKNAGHGLPDIHANVAQYAQHMEEALSASVDFFDKYLKNR